MALLSCFKILPQDLPDLSGALLSQLTSAAITNAKTTTHQKRGPYLKLDDRMRANVHVCIHMSVVITMHLPLVKIYPYEISAVQYTSTHSVLTI